MVGIVLGSALGTIADTMKENREYLKEKKSLLQERMVMSGLENRAALKKARAERTARLDAAMGLGFSERAATALELTGQLEFQLAKVMDLKKDLDPTYIPNLTSGLESRIDDNEELAKAVAEGLSGPLNSIEDQENAFQRALKSTSITDFDEELNKLIMYTGGTPNSYSEKFSITPGKGSVITDPEFKNIDSIITDGLSVLYSDMYETDSEGRTRIKLDQPGGEEVKFLFNNLSKEATKIAQDPFNTFSTVGAAQFIIDKITPASGLPASVVNENLNESLTSSEPSYWDRFRN